MSRSKVTYILVRVGSNADVETVRSRLRANIAEVEILTPSEFRDRSRTFWLFGTGAGFALFAGALLGIAKVTRVDPVMAFTRRPSPVMGNATGVVHARPIWVGDAIIANQYSR